MHQYPGAAVFFLIDEIPPGIALVNVRSFGSGTFWAPSLNIFQFLQDILRDSYDPLTAGGGTHGLFLLSQRAEECRNIVKE
jgi:hypothetical protein